MNRVEFRIEQVPLNRDGPPTLHLVERLAELGRQGWHVASADLTPHPSDREGRVTVLLERELDDDCARASLARPAALIARAAEPALEPRSVSSRPMTTKLGALPRCETQAERSAPSTRWTPPLPKADGVAQ